jgi:hypothetical protein
MVWIHLDQDRMYWGDLVNAVMNAGILNEEDFLINERLSAPQVVLCFMELLIQF